jgi:hypothetical protein
MAIALVTGTSTGIGFATALALGRAGHEVYATMRQPSAAPSLQTAATKESLPITILSLNVDDDSVKNAVDRVFRERERIDVLINNTGILTMGPIEELTLHRSSGTREPAAAAPGADLGEPGGQGQQGAAQPRHIRDRTHCRHGAPHHHARRTGSRFRHAGQDLGRLAARVVELEVVAGDWAATSNLGRALSAQPAARRGEHGERRKDLGSVLCWGQTGVRLA